MASEYAIPPDESPGYAIIAAVKGWHAGLSALLFFIPARSLAAEDGNAAARELARKTAAFAGRGEGVTVTWNDISSLGPAGLLQTRTAFEAALRESGVRIADSVPAAEAHLTLSENRTDYLLVEEIRKSDDRQVWIASWKRAASRPTLGANGITLDKKLLWEQDEPILDVALPAGFLLVLSPSRVSLFARRNGQWQTTDSASINAAKPWPRDLRGRLRINSATFQVWLPGMSCSGAMGPPLAVNCRPGDEPWVLESGSRALLLAHFTPARNYFDGRITTQSGLPKSVLPFYSAASVEDQGRAFWLLTLLDGRTQLFDATTFDAGSSIAAWGSDIAGTDAQCGGGSQVLATRPVDGATPDSVQAFSIVNRVPSPLTAPVEFPGPVTSLWPSGGSSAAAIVHNLSTGRYEAYLLTAVCPQ